MGYSITISKEIDLWNEFEDDCRAIVRQHGFSNLKIELGTILDRWNVSLWLENGFHFKETVDRKQALNSMLKESVSKTAEIYCNDWLAKHPIKPGFNIKNNTLLFYIEEPGVEEVVVPKHVKTIEPFAFKGCKNIKSIVLPDGLKTIRESTFSECNNLEHINIPSTVTRIHKFAFYKCFNIDGLVLPDDVQSVGYCALIDVKHVSYRSVKIPDVCLSLDSMRSVIKIVRDFDFRKRLSPECKNLLIWRMYMADPDNSDLDKRVKGAFITLFETAIHYGEKDIVQFVIDRNLRLNRQNIDKFIRKAIDCQQHEIQVMLLNYKQRYIGFRKKNWNL